MISERFDAAIAAFDAANGEDPNLEAIDGQSRPRELVQAERLSSWIQRLAPNASEPLRLAARCQHIRRWTVARSEYPLGRVGYLQWRTHLGRMHADTAAEILRGVGYDADLIENVRRIVTKQGLRSNPDAQTMEDALCLSFLEHEALAFAGKHDSAKVIGILRKTWKKISPRAREVALGLDLAPALRQAIEAALAAPESSDDGSAPD